MNGNQGFLFLNKMHILIVVYICFSALCYGSIQDPVMDYIAKQSGGSGCTETIQKPVFITFREPRYHQDDCVFRCDVDLNKDGKKEILISSTLEADGNQGLLWKVYAIYDEKLHDVGFLTFNPTKVYVGPLDDGKYGLATFGPSGAGEGTMLGYLFDGNRIQQIVLGNVALNRKTMKLEGEEIISKYLGEKAIVGEDVVRRIGADELASKYGVKVDPRTYRQALEEEMSPSPSRSQSTPTPPAAVQTTPVPAVATPVEQPNPDISRVPSKGGLGV